jgi:hypothetical protein
MNAALKQVVVFFKMSQTTVPVGRPSAACQPLLRIKEDTCHYACLGVSRRQHLFNEDQLNHATLSSYRWKAVQRLQAPSWIDAVSWQQGKSRAIYW